MCFLSVMSLEEMNAKKSSRDVKMNADTNVIVPAFISNSIPTKIHFQK